MPLSPVKSRHNSKQFEISIIAEMKIQVVFFNQEITAVKKHLAAQIHMPRKKNEESFKTPMPDQTKP